MGFVESPFKSGEQGFLFRTGDLGRYLSDGQVEIIGRRDDQVKIQGVRVEPAEISAVLAEEKQVAQSFVGPFVGGDEKVWLVAWVVLVKESGHNTSSLRRLLAHRLPQALIPNKFVFLDRLPLTPNGKVDRSQLPNPDIDIQTEFVGPRSSLEERLSSIWCEVFGQQKIGVHDDFFELGGHSLLAIRIGGRVASEFQIAYPLRSLFEAPTIAATAVGIEQLIGGEDGDPSFPLVRVDRDSNLRFKNLTQFGVVKMPGAVEASGSITKLKHRCRHTTA